MGTIIVKQPNGKFALWSIPFGMFTLMNMTRDEVFEEFRQSAVQDFQEEMDKKLDRAVSTGTSSLMNQHLWDNLLLLLPKRKQAELRAECGISEEPKSALVERWLLMDGDACIGIYFKDPGELGAGLDHVRVVHLREVREEADVVSAAHVVFTGPRTLARTQLGRMTPDYGEKERAFADAVGVSETDMLEIAVGDVAPTVTQLHNWCLAADQELTITFGRRPGNKNTGR